MPTSGTRTCAPAVPARRRNGRATGSRGVPPESAGDGGPPWGAPEPGETGHGARRGRDGGREEAAGKPEAAVLGGLLRGLRAGDLECVLLTVAMAAEENRMPSADPDEVQRILGFLARLAEHDAALPPPPDGGQRPTRDGIDAEGGGAPAR